MSILELFGYILTVIAFIFIGLPIIFFCLFMLLAILSPFIIVMLPIIAFAMIFDIILILFKLITKKE